MLAVQHANVICGWIIAAGFSLSACCLAAAFLGACNPFRSDILSPTPIADGIFKFFPWPAIISLILAACDWPFIWLWSL